MPHPGGFVMSIPLTRRQLLSFAFSTDTRQSAFWTRSGLWTLGVAGPVLLGLPAISSWFLVLPCLVFVAVFSWLPVLSRHAAEHGGEGFVLWLVALLAVSLSLNLALDSRGVLPFLLASVVQGWSAGKLFFLWQHLWRQALLRLDAMPVGEKQALVGVLDAARSRARLERFVPRARVKSPSLRRL